MRVAATPLTGAAVTRGRHRSVVPGDAGDGRWPHVYAVYETVPEPDANKLSLDLGIAVCPCVWLAVAVSLGHDSRGHRFAGCGRAERESRSRSGAT